MNRLEKIRAQLVAMRAWVAKQPEPFDTNDFAGRFNLRHLQGVRYLRQLQDEGVVRQVSKEQFKQCAVFARAS